MATVLIRHLDDSACDVLRERASASGRSLQEYVRFILERHASEPTVAEALSSVRNDLTWAYGGAPQMGDVVDLRRAEPGR